MKAEDQNDTNVMNSKDNQGRESTSNEINEKDKIKMQEKKKEKGLAGNQVVLSPSKVVKPQDALTFTPGHGNFSWTQNYHKKVTNNLIAIGGIHSNSRLQNLRTL